MKCPCENCICVAVCGNKLYGDLIDDCSLLREFMQDPFFATKSRTQCLKDLEKYLAPSTWKVLMTADKMAYIADGEKKLGCN